MWEDNIAYIGWAVSILLVVVVIAAVPLGRALKRRAIRFKKWIQE